MQHQDIDGRGVLKVSDTSRYFSFLLMSKSQIEQENHVAQYKSIVIRRCTGTVKSVVAVASDFFGREHDCSIKNIHTFFAKIHELLACIDLSDWTWTSIPLAKRRVRRGNNEAFIEHLDSQLKELNGVARLSNLQKAYALIVEGLDSVHGIHGRLHIL